MVVSGIVVEVVVVELVVVVVELVVVVLGSGSVVVLVVGAVWP